MSTTIAIVEDHPLFRRALAEIVRDEADLTLTGEFASGEEALPRILAKPPDVVVLDLHLPGIDGSTVLRRLSDAGCSSRCLVLTGSVGPETLYELVAIGAAGAVSKGTPVAQIRAAIRAVARGATVFGADMQAELVGQIRARWAHTRPVLSDRERRILQMAATGMTNHEIAGAIHVSAATVKADLSSVMGKLGAGDRASAVATGIRTGLIV